MIRMTAGGIEAAGVDEVTSSCLDTGGKNSMIILLDLWIILNSNTNGLCGILFGKYSVQRLARTSLLYCHSGIDIEIERN